MLVIGGFVVVFGARPPYNDRQQRVAGLIETARTGGRILCLIGVVLLAAGGLGLLAAAAGKD